MLQDFKIALDWAREKFDYAKLDSQRKPEDSERNAIYIDASNTYKEIKNRFDIAVKNFITIPTKP